MAESRVVLIKAGSNSTRPAETLTIALGLALEKAGFHLLTISLLSTLPNIPFYIQDLGTSGQKDYSSGAAAVQSNMILIPVKKKYQGTLILWLQIPGNPTEITAVTSCDYMRMN